ncbi:TetR/AcrR family transcriptional regulator [Pseudonocardia sp. RS11V-5]|uniref:TetR/AcrR family transcriptional regulator n=1 Tax=Pseudonocardia terrae TaxID=2905831 RepID=UPI001E3A3442|nr:TetR/AcrR family transcriptional regulator [Pseudonocardia terrae]MCE3554994.1 TetR/AcrR family transcriptional regulator [Pseudonocardia terrae]
MGVTEPRVGTRRGRPPVSEERRRAQRLEISRHAVRLFRAHGVAATSGEQIARAAGVSERTLWRSFRSKESCVEPLLSQSLEAFQAVLVTWPPGVALADHLRDGYMVVPEDSWADLDAVLAVVRLTCDEPALRAVWLVLHERAEPAIAAALAGRFGLPADSLEVRARAAVVNAALRVATDDLARAAEEGVEVVHRHRGLVAEVLRLVDRPDAR